MSGRATHFGDRAIVVESDDPPSLIAGLRLEFPTARVRVGLAEVLVEFASPTDVPEDVLARIESVRPGPTTVLAREHEFAIDYDGPDLPTAAARLAMAPSQLAQLHAETAWRVAMIGFAPGFPYLVPRAGSFPDLDRLSSPRAKVSAGAVGIAAGMSCIYPGPLPGGWLIIGHTDANLFDAKADPPATLRAGDVVRFRVT